MTDRTVYNREQYLKNREKRLADQKEYYRTNKEARARYNKEYAEKNREVVSAQRKSYREKNSEVRKEKLREWYLKNTEYAKLKAKMYRQENREALAKKAAEYRREKMKNDPLYALKVRIRGLIGVKLWSNGYTKRSRTHTILGCSFEDFRSHIEEQFTEGMSWNNHGEWHLDHITPIASAKSEEDVIRLNHYTNFRPLWAIDNLRKGAKHNDQ